MTNEELKAIEERWAKATPGPWEICLGSGGNVCTGIHHYLKDGSGSIFVADCLTDYMLSKAVKCEDDHRQNLKAIASAPTDIAALLAEVRRLNRMVVNAQHMIAGISPDEVRKYLEEAAGNG